MKLKLAGLAAAALLATPAAAPASSIEHTVRTVTFEASYTVDGVVPRSERFERWVAFDRAHQVITDHQHRPGALRGGAGAAEVHGVRRRAQRGLDAPGGRGQHAARHVRAHARRRGRRRQDPGGEGVADQDGRHDVPRPSRDQARERSWRAERRQHEADDRRRRLDLRAVRAHRHRPRTRRDLHAARSRRVDRDVAAGRQRARPVHGPGSARAKRVTSSQQGKAMLEESKKKRAVKPKAAKKKSKKPSRR